MCSSNVLAELATKLVINILALIAPFIIGTNGNLAGCFTLIGTQSYQFARFHNTDINTLGNLPNGVT